MIAQDPATKGSRVWLGNLEGFVLAKNGRLPDEEHVQRKCCVISKKYKRPCNLQLLFQFAREMSTSACRGRMNQSQPCESIHAKYDESALLRAHALSIAVKTLGELFGAGLGARLGAPTRIWANLAAVDTTSTATTPFATPSKSSTRTSTTAKMADQEYVSALLPPISL